MNTMFESITVMRNGIVELKFRKRPIDPYNESGDVRGWHCFSLVPGEDLAAALAVLNSSLASIGVMPIDADSWARVESQCAAAWTDEIITAFNNSQTQ